MALASLVEVLALLVGAGALLASLGATAHALRWARAPLERAAWRPFATVIVPCKGLHQGFDVNVLALARQDHPDYEALFVVDERDDPCALALHRLRAEEPRIRMVLSEPEVVGDDWATGKVVAQLTGVQHASPRSEVLVFADADARPGPGWLSALVAPLAEPGIGGSTGFRWYCAASRPTVWTALRDAWNATGVDAMTMERLRFLWGGSMAVKRADFERSGVRAHWKRAVSEDVGLTRAVQDLGLGLAFAPGALVASPEDWTRAEVLDWVVRQSALTRTYLPRVFRFAAFVYALALVLPVLGGALLALRPSPLLALAGALMLAPTASALPRALLRERLVRRVLPLPSTPGERTLQLLLSLALPPFTLWGLARARRTRHIAWRGRSYALTPLDDAG